MIKRLLLAILITLPLPSAAQMAMGEFDRFGTRFGEAQVIGGEFDQMLAFNGQTFPEIGGPQVAILGGIGIEGEAYDWLLIRRTTGGNGCFPVHSIARVSGQGVVTSPPFGHCVADPIEVRALSGAVEVDMSHPDVTIELQTFRFDGVTLSDEQTVAQITQAPAGARPDVLRWIETHPFEIFDDPSERARFQTIMPRNEVSALANHVSVANGTFQRGDWVIGQGCLPHQCNSARGVWGLRISDGAAGAVILGPNGYEAAYGLAQSDPVLRAVIEAHRP